MITTLNQTKRCSGKKRNVLFKIYLLNSLDDMITTRKGIKLSLDF